MKKKHNLKLKFHQQKCNFLIKIKNLSKQYNFRKHNKLLGHPTHHHFDMAL